MSCDEIVSMAQKAAELVRNYGQASSARPKPARRFSPTERARGRETDLRRERAALDSIADALLKLSDPIADAMERAGIDSTPWINFVSELTRSKDAAPRPQVLDLLLRLQRRARLGLVPQ